MTQKTNPALDPKRKRLFTIMTLAVPIVFFILLETILQLAQYGPDLAIFSRETIGGKSCYTLNPACKNRYFTTTEFTPDPSPEYLLADKPAGSYRIFCLGGSTTVGYPYWYNGAFATFLRDRLKTIFPDRHIEVINLGMTATNSYTVLDIGKELIKYKPDLYLVYDGHNEFYGAFGVASHARMAPARWMNLLYLRLVHVRTFQLVKSGLQRATGLFATAPSDRGSRSTLMEQVAAGKNVPCNSKTYQQAIHIFQQNLKDLARLCREQHIPLILATQASNLRDQPPFVSNHSPDITKQEQTQFAEIYQKALAFQTKGQMDSAITYFRTAIAVDSAHADAHYRLARCLDDSPDKKECLSEYVSARDYDELRFRTDSRFNDLIRSMEDGRHCFVADIERVFASHSPDSLIGLNLISEHLHPRARGQFLIAREYAAIMAKQGLLAARPDWQTRGAADDTLLWQQRALTDIDEYTAARKIEMLTSRWPFTNQAQAVSPINRSDTLRFIAEQAVHNRIGWITLHEQAAEYYQQRRQTALAAREYETILNQLPHHLVPYLKLAKIYFDNQDFSEAEKLLLASLQVEKTSVAYRVLGDIRLKQRRALEAIQYYQLLAKMPEDPATAADNAYMLALAYLVAQQPGQAVPLLERTIARFPAYQPARQLLMRVKSSASPLSTH